VQSSKRNLMGLEGFPTLIEYGWVDLVTTDPAPTMEPTASVTPERITELSPTHTSDSIEVNCSLGRREEPE
tara:strand:- start:215 stop:427 length:213 start_codon:yes stop_codon:yes gene_type:complete